MQPVPGLASVACAADIGHIHRMIQLWLNADRTNAVLDIENGTVWVCWCCRIK